MILRNPPVNTECPQCGNPSGHNLGCHIWHQQTLAALDSRDQLLAEAREALAGVVRVADRATIEFDAARTVLAKLKAAAAIADATV